MSRPLIPNGSLRIAFDGIHIEALFGEGCFGALQCCLDMTDLSITSERISGSGIHHHEIVDDSIAPGLTITKRRIPECRVTDLPHPDAPIFVRMIEAVDGISFRILPAEGTDLRFLQNYKFGAGTTTIALLSRTDEAKHRRKLLCLIPTGNLCFREADTPDPDDSLDLDDSLFSEGSPDSDEILDSESSPHPDGSLHSDGSPHPDGSPDPDVIPDPDDTHNPAETPPPEIRLYAEPGISALILAAGDSLSEIIPTATKLAKQLDHPCAAADSPLFAECAELWRRRLSVMNPTLLGTCFEEAALHLLAHCSPDGKILGGDGSPLPFSDTPPVIECLARLGFTAEAKAAADRMFAHYQSHGFTLGYEEGLSCTNPSVSAPAAMAEAQLAYYSATRDDEFLKERLPMLIKAAMTMREELSGGLLCFGGDERLFAYGMLHPRAVDQASASATLRFIRIAESVLDFVSRNRLRARKGYYEALTESYAMAKSAFLRDFLADGMLWENNPRRLGHQRSPRFLYGICEVCGRMDHLERTGDRHSDDRHYACLDCIEKPLPKRDYPRQIPAISALAHARGLIPDRTLSRLARIHAKSLLEGNLPLVEGSATGLLLRLMAELIASGFGGDTLRGLCGRLYERTLAEGVIRAGCYPRGALPIAEGDPTATAGCILGLLEVEKIL